MIKQFLRDVDWGEVDYLIVDTPPGTSDEHLSIVQYLSGAGIDGAVIITTPQEVSLQDVRKEIRFCKKVKIPIIGVIENMSGFVCPKCKNTSQIFPPTTGGAQRMCEELNLPLLGRVPLDPRIGRSCDEGRSFLTEVPDSPAAVAYQNIVQSFVNFVLLLGDQKSEITVLPTLHQMILVDAEMYITSLSSQLGCPMNSDSSHVINQSQKKELTFTIRRVTGTVHLKASATLYLTAAILGKLIDIYKLNSLFSCSIACMFQ
ncbi:hypothetical protein cypCar_00015179 [Cyprinus carpio]|nr:hypothetical protein cypCar_00015179 [Cyprinus carpio]